MENNIPTQLYLVPTPIGNLEDITYRAVRVLQEVDVILAEDTRVTKKLLQHYGIENTLKPFHSFNEHKQVHAILEELQSGKVMALVSDAGTPGISDPGFLLIRECLRASIKTECLPGATAFVPALVNSGFPTDRFVFEGFLPHKKGRQKKINQLAEEQRTVVLYESPHRLIKTLQQLKETLGSERIVSVSRELTKIYEETVTGTLTEVLGHFGDKKIKGELVVIIKGDDGV